MKEQDEAHSFEETPKWVTDYNANRQAVNVLEAELTRLRSELQHAKQEIANHIAVNSLLTDSEGEADLANKLYKATSELQQEREQLIECLEAIHRWYITDDGYWGTETHKFAESLIKKAKL